MTDERSRKIEEAATKMADIWDHATMDFNSRDIAKLMGHENYRAMFDAWSALRAALALPASGRGYDVAKEPLKGRRVCRDCGAVAPDVRPVGTPEWSAPPATYTVCGADGVTREYQRETPATRCDKCEGTKFVWTTTAPFYEPCPACGGSGRGAK